MEDGQKFYVFSSMVFIRSSASLSMRSEDRNGFQKAGSKNYGRRYAGKTGCKEKTPFNIRSPDNITTESAKVHSPPFGTSEYLSF